MWKTEEAEEERMKKEFLTSMTFWGALGLGLVVFLEGIGVELIWVLPLAKGLSALLATFGIRRALG